MSGPDEPMVSIIIPTWNGWELLRACLDSIRRQTYQDLEIIVVDDGSTDNTAARLEAEYPEVACLISPENRGFAPTANRGLLAARGTWVFLLNNDVTLEDTCLERLMAAAIAGPYTMLCPLVLCTGNPDLIYSAGDVVGVGGRPTSLGYQVRRAGYDCVEEPFGVSGGYGLFKGTLLDEVGLLDEAFVAYFEDSDLCFRARWAGHRAALVSEAVAHHVGSASIHGRTWWRTRQCFQNHALLVLKNFPLPLLWRNRRAIVQERCHQWARLFRVARAEWGALRAVFFSLGAWGGLLYRVPGALYARRRILGARVCTVDEIQLLLEKGHVDDQGV